MSVEILCLLLSQTRNSGSMDRSWESLIYTFDEIFRCDYTGILVFVYVRAHTHLNKPQFV